MSLNIIQDVSGGIVIVSSIDPDKLRTDKSKNDGPKRMKEYLRYAKAVGEHRLQDAHSILLSLSNSAVRRENTIIDDDSASLTNTNGQFEKMVQDKLQKLGYQVDIHIGN